MKKTLLISALAFSAVHTASAAYLFFDTPAKLSAGTDSVIVVRLNTEGKSINSIEGSLGMRGIESEISTISVGGSALTLWPNKPSLNGSEISFTGGSTSGLSGENIPLFTLYLKPSSVTNSYLSVKSMVAYQDDGQGTPLHILPMVTKLADIRTGQISTATPSTLDAMLLSDTTPPEPFAIELGKDDTTFEGQYFISFQTRDSQSGINRYEIQEGDRPYIRSGTPYILQDQSLKSRVTVKAIDNSGNAQIATFEKKPYPWIVLITTLLVIMGVILRVRKLYQ